MFNCKSLLLHNRHRLHSLLVSLLYTVRQKQAKLTADLIEHRGFVSIMTAAA